MTMSTAVLLWPASMVGRVPAAIAGHHGGVRWSAWCTDPSSRIYNYVIQTRAAQHGGDDVAGSRRRPVVAGRPLTDAAGLHATLSRKLALPIAVHRAGRDPTFALRELDLAPQARSARDRLSE